MAGLISINQVLHEKDTGKNLRILYIAPDASSLYWIDLSEKGGMPAVTDLAGVEASILSGERAVSEDIWTTPQTDSEKALARRDSLWQLLGSVLQKEPEVYDRNLRMKMLKEISERSGIAVPNLYPYMKRYWRMGKVKDALLPSDDRKGGKGKSRILTHNTGTAPSQDAEASKVLTREDFQIFEEYAKYYQGHPSLTLMDAYDKMVEARYSDITKDGNGMEQVISYGQGRTPTFRQFSYWYKKTRNRNKETVKRKGQSQLDLRERAVTGKADHGMKGPGAQFQIDATIADVYLVSRFNRASIIGRPVVYFVKDTFSRMVTGLYIGLEGPSWMGMAMALYNAFTDKVGFCHQYGIEITEDQWPCHHLPFSLIGDRGELESDAGFRVAEKLGIQIDNTPPYRGDLKPIIERHFKILNDMTVHRLPGNVRPELDHRGGHDYRLDALLDLYQFTRIIIHETLTYNKLTLKSLEPSEEMMRSGVELTPVSLWNWGISNCAGSLRVLPEEKVRLALMPEGSCEIRKEGICFHNLFFTCEEAVEGQWFEDARRGHPSRRKVSYDPRDMRAIYVWDEDGIKAVRAELLDWEQKYSGKALDECLYEQEAIEAAKIRNRKRDKDALLTAKRFADSVVEEAKAMRPDTSGVSKSERVKDIAANHEKEKEAQRQQESFVKPAEDGDARGTVPAAGEAGGQEAPEIRRKREMTPLEKLIWEMDNE